MQEKHIPMDKVENSSNTARTTQRACFVLKMR